jgi:CheY-like chemotaxis protein
MRDCEPFMTGVDPKMLAGHRVLVVEDEYFIADDLARALAMLGATVLGPVPSEEEALALIEAPEPPELAILDLNLRGAASFALAQRLEERGIPFLFATGYERSSVPARFAAVPRWEKPYDPASLARAVAGLLPTKD